MPARVARGVLVSHWNSFVPSRCRTSHYCITFVPLSVSLWNDLDEPVFDGVGLEGFKSRAMQFLLVGLICSFFLYFSTFRGLAVWGWSLRIDSVLTLPSLAVLTYF